MDQREEKNRDLEGLFAYSRDAVLGVRRGGVEFANAAADRLFGRKAAGERLESLLPELTGAICRESGVTAVTVAGSPHTVTLVARDDLTVVTVLHEAAAPGGVGSAVLSRLRSAAFSLRFSLDRMYGARPSPEKDLNIVYRSYFTLEHLIGQLSDAEALARGEPVMRRQVLDLAAVVRELVGSVSFFVGDRSAELLCEIDEGDYPVRGDRERLEQLILILLGNSLQHTPAGGRIRVCLRAAAQRYVLSVDDNGEGMDGAALAGAFNPRTGDDLSAAAGGSGLGLFIAYELARAHGGAIVLQSDPGGGTRVRVMLPRCGDLYVCEAPPPTPRGPERILAELSGVLPAEAYDPKHRL